MVDETNKAFGWDEQVIDDPGGGDDFRLLEPGEYNFIVKGLKRANFNGSQKMCACPMAIIQIGVSDEMGEVDLFHNLYLNLKCKGLLARFFASIGLHKHGEALNLAWNQVVGRSGRCIVAHRDYNGKQYNDLKKFLDPPAGAEPAPASDQGEIPF